MYRGSRPKSIGGTNLVKLSHCFIKIIIILALVFNSLGCLGYDFAYEHQFQHLNREQGLSQGTGYAINQDSKGFIWIGTQEGLNRFDGRRMKVYQRDDRAFALSDSYIYAIENDPSDPLKMWLGTHGGLQSYNHQSGQFHRFQGKHSARQSNNKVYAIKFVSNQTAWLGTGYGLNWIDIVNHESAPTELVYKNADIEKINTVYSIELIDKDNLLVATPAGLFRFNLTKKEIIEHYPLTNKPIVWKLLKDNRGTIWVGTSNGVYHFKNNQLSAFKLTTDDILTIDKNILSFLQTRDSKIWIGTGSGIHLYDEDYQFVTHLYKDSEVSSSLTNNTIWSIFEDSSGIVWVGTDNGVSRFNPDSLDFHTLRKRSDNKGLTDDWVSGIYRSGDGTLWVGTNNGVEGFNQKGERQWHFNSQNGLSSPWVYSIYQQSMDYLWVGTYQGLNVIDLAQGQVLELPEPLRQTTLYQDRIWCFLAEGTEFLWIGATSGLYRVNLTDGSYDKYSKPGSSNLGHIYALHSLSRDKIWVGTSDGLYLLDLNAGQVSKMKVGEGKGNSAHSNSTHNKLVTDITSDKNGRLWLSTDRGIYFQQQSGSFKYLSHIPQTRQYIYALEVDDNNDLWFSTNAGMGRLHYSGESLESFSSELFLLELFTKNDGLQNDEFNEFASFKDENGHIYFGGVSGLNKVIPKELGRRKNSAPVAAITDLEVNGQKVYPQWREKQSPVIREIGWTDSVELAFYQNYLTFYLAALDFANPKSNKIQYRMLGFDEKWKSTTDNQPFVNFQRLAPGEYVFQVRAASARSDWNGDVASLAISISPPFWMSNFAFLCYLLVVVGVIYWSFRQYKLRLRRLQQIVAREQQVAARLIEVDAIKDQFLANASHELKTPLNAIIGLSEYLMTENTMDLDSVESAEALKLIRDSGSRMNDLVEDILQCSTLNRGKLNLTFSSVNLWTLVEECFKEIKLSKAVDSIELINQVASTLPPVSADKNRAKQILINLISNAVKFTHQGFVKVQAKALGGKIWIDVIDSGIGIKSEYHQSIFEAFVQVDGTFSRKYEGSGLGLSIVKQLVELHGGEVKIDSQLGVGTSIGFSLAIYQENGD